MKRLFLACFVSCILSHATAQTSATGSVRTGRLFLSKTAALNLANELWSREKRLLKDSLAAEWRAEEIQYKDYRLRFKYSVRGESPPDGRSLYISMHGGGNQTAVFNDQQWRNQQGLYRPKEGVYIAPRAPTDTWNLWHQSHIDTLFDRLIRAAVVFQGVNPSKVYIMGYSAGGDGTYQLAPRMADRWAAAAMMAGHPNEVTPYGLRNVAFSIDMGGLDSAYSRNDIARRWARLLDSLESKDPGGYKHRVVIHEGRGHWMNREDSVAIPWMTKFHRNALPDRIVWVQDDVLHSSYYWLAVDMKQAKAGETIVARYSKAGNSINIDRNDSRTLILRLNDRMLDMDKPVSVFLLGKRVFYGKVARRTEILRRTVKERKDPDLIFSGQITIENGKVIKDER